MPSANANAKANDTANANPCARIQNTDAKR